MDNNEKDPVENVQKTPVENTQETVTPEVAEVAEAAVAVEEKKEKVFEIPPERQTPHDDFDWTIGNKNTLAYTADEIKKYKSDYEETMNSVAESEVVIGVVTSITDGDVVLNINYKSDGLVSLSEFRDTPDLGVGDSVKVYVENQEDERGQLILSRRKAKLIQAWDDIVDSYENGTIIKGLIVSKTKGGLIADCNGLETFLPGSQIDIKPIIDM
jgi:small subunit ribosomal protein S1